MRTRPAAAGLACLLAVVQIATASAATATSDLIPGPPDGSWSPFADDTKPLTKDDLYGSKAGNVQGFVDAYRKSWSHEPAQGLVDQLERFSSVFWAAFRLSDSRAAAKTNPKHNSYKDLPGLGASAYEVTDPADAQGFLNDQIVLTSGDYVAVIDIASTSQPDHEVLMDQARRQVAAIPAPSGEFNATGRGIVTTMVGFAIVAGVISIIVSAVVLAVVLRRRRRPAVDPRQPLISPDGRYWWDGTAWRPIPPP